MRDVTANPLEMHGVSRHYDMGGSRVTALDHADLVVRPHEVVMLVGPSGSGKTTLLSIAGGLLSPSDGQVLVAGVDISKASARQLTTFRRERIGFIFQSVNLVPFLTARENLLVVSEFAKRDMGQARTRADKLLTELGLGHRLTNLPSQLSGGERQRVAIGRALMNQPSLVLVDEPTSALDSKLGLQVMELIVAEVKSRGAAAVIVTHDPRMTRFGDRTMAVADGRLVTEAGRGGERLALPTGGAAGAPDPRSRDRFSQPAVAPSGEWPAYKETVVGSGAPDRYEQPMVGAGNQDWNWYENPAAAAAAAAAAASAATAASRGVSYRSPFEELVPGRPDQPESRSAHVRALGPGEPSGSSAAVDPYSTGDPYTGQHRAVGGQRGPSDRRDWQEREPDASRFDTGAAYLAPSQRQAPPNGRGAPRPPAPRSRPGAPPPPPPPPRFGWDGLPAGWPGAPTNRPGPERQGGRPPQGPDRRGAPGQRNGRPGPSGPPGGQGTGTHRAIGPQGQPGAARPGPPRQDMGPPPGPAPGRGRPADPYRTGTHAAVPDGRPRPRPGGPPPGPGGRRSQGRSSPPPAPPDGYRTGTHAAVPDGRGGPPRPGRPAPPPDPHRTGTHAAVPGGPRPGQGPGRPPPGAGRPAPPPPRGAPPRPSGPPPPQSRLNPYAVGPRPPDQRNGVRPNGRPVNGNRPGGPPGARRPEPSWTDADEDRYPAEPPRPSPYRDRPPPPGRGPRGGQPRRPA